MKDKATDFDCQSGPSITAGWVFTSMKVLLEWDVLSSFPSLFLLPSFASRASSICCQLGSSALYHGVLPNLLSLVSGLAGAFGYLRWHFNLCPARVHAGSIQTTAVTSETEHILTSNFWCHGNQRVIKNKSLRTQNSS